jgi:hypothetical protein
VRFNRFRTVSWAPGIEESLLTLLAYRSTHPKKNGMLLPREELNPHEFIALLSRYSKAAPEELPQLISDEHYDLLMSKEAFALPFLVHGWKEAALQLNAFSVIPKNFPDWISLLLAQAIQENRSSQAALEFALKQPDSARLSLLIAHLALALDQKQVAFVHLSSIYKMQNQVGLEAARLLLPLAHEQGNLLLAQEAIRAHASLSSTVEGREKLARLALENGNPIEAAFLYAEIEGQSAEAKSFLATKAYNEQDWARARTLTEQLIALYPDNDTLKANLKKIVAQQNN